MAFMSPSHKAAGPARVSLPILAYKAPAGRLTSFGTGCKTRVRSTGKPPKPISPMAQPAFALDFGRLEVGWCHFTAGAAPQWNMVPYGQKMPDRPAIACKDDTTGKDLNYRNGLSSPRRGQRHRWRA